MFLGLLDLDLDPALDLNPFIKKQKNEEKH